MLPLDNFFSAQAVSRFPGLEEAHQLFLGAKSISFHCHVDPDRDTVNSAHAMAMVAQHLGKRVQVIYPNEPGFFVGSCVPQMVGCHAFVPDLALLLDSPTRQRVYFPKSFDAVKVIGIDHHKGYIIDGTFNFVDPLMPAAAAVAAIILSGWSTEYLKISKTDNSVAQFLLEGLLDDSQFFKISTANQESLLVATHLINCGADFDKAKSKVLVRKPLRLAKLWSEIIFKADHQAEVDTLFVFCSKAMMDFYNTAEDQQKGLSSFLAGLVEVDTVVAITESVDGLKVSMRSKKLNVAELCTKFGGGGHIRAAGFSSAKRDYPALKAEILSKMTR